jgi:3,4-dihydroxy 2-butanone 4-phosphate synthase/GTP cyclohydrolase II
VGKPVEVASVTLPTPYGEFLARAFTTMPSGWVYLALVRGEVGAGKNLLARLHSECLTGDALGSLRCDCGVQLRLAMRAIAAEGRGVLVYATGQEGRGIGLVNKLRAYVEQDAGADTVDANLRLGLPAENRNYATAAAVLRAVGVQSVRLLTNNPAKVRGLVEAGIHVECMLPTRTTPHARNLGYLRTKGRRMGHLDPSGEDIASALATPPDVNGLLGQVKARTDRPYVVLKYAQTLDGRIATADGDSRWISGEQERSISHGLRASCDAVLVGVGTVLRDDPQLTVRMVPGASPIRVVLDTTLRTPLAARVLDIDAATLIVTTERSRKSDRHRLEALGIGVWVVPTAQNGVDIAVALATLRARGIRSLLVEGGAQVITSFLGGGFVDRLIVGTAPKIIGSGTEAVGDLGVARIADGIRLSNRCVSVTDDDVLMAWDVDQRTSPWNRDRVADVVSDRVVLLAAGGDQS